MGKLALAGEKVCKNRKRFFAVTKKYGGLNEGLNAVGASDNGNARC